MTTQQGAWPSPVKVEHLLGAKKYYQLFSTSNALYFVQGNPEEKGRATLYAYKDGALSDSILPREYGIKSRVHEFGGACVCEKDGTLYFVNKDTQNIHSVQGGEVKQILDDPGMRYADLAAHPTKPWIACVQEEHTHEPDIINTIALVHLERKNTCQVLHSGCDFYARPRFSKDGTKIAFIAWNFPHMPWEESVLLEGTIQDDGTIKDLTIRAGGNGTSVDQVFYTSANELVYTLDASGFWELYKEDSKITSASLDFGYPHWVFGIERVAEKDAHSLFAIGTKNMLDMLYEINLEKGDVTPIDTGHTMYGSLSMLNGTLYAVSSGPTQPLGLRKLEGTTLVDIHLFESLDLSQENISCGELLSYTTEQFGEAYGFYYPPKLHGHTSDKPPPLILRVHGGPTGHVSNNFKITTQFFTTRGFAVFDLNHSGSTGNGKAFRERLDGKWGELDPIEACAAATMLCEKKLANPNALCITGGSAGGFTTLNSLTFHDVFTCGISLYGICDLELLAKDTHKFEKEMLNRLVAPYPEKKEIYHERSALHHTDSLNKPLLLVQGSEDTIVPPNQSEKLYSALLKKGVPVAYLLFEGEGHGIRQGEHVMRMYASMLSFLQRIFTIPAEHTSDDIHIDNLDDH